MNALKGSAIVYEAVLHTPGMEEDVKIVFRASRKDILLLSQIIDLGLNNEETINSAPAGTFDGLRALDADLLSQAKFTAEFIERWRFLTGRS